MRVPPDDSERLQLVTPEEAAQLLKVGPHTIHGWIARGRLPYVELPGDARGIYRIPLQGLLLALPTLHKLERELDEVDRAAKRGRLTEGRVLDLLDRDAH